MQFPNITLLQLLAEEHIELSSVSITAVKRKSLLELEGECGVHDIESDDELDETETMRTRVEEMMLMLHSVSSRKCKRDSSKSVNNKMSRLSKHGSRRLKFVDPTTMERKPLTHEHSMWCNNYTAFPQPECSY